jgi:hypothetical protein
MHGNMQFIGNNREWFNYCLPRNSFNTTIFAYWDNMILWQHEGDGVFVSTSGSAPNRVFNVEWRVRTQANINNRMSLQIRLYEGQSHFDLVYGQMNGNTAHSATIGVQRGNGSLWAQFSCEEGVVANGRMVRFEQQPCSSFTPSATGTPIASTSTPLVTGTPVTPTSTAVGLTATPGGPSVTPSLASPTATACAISFSDVPSDHVFYTYVMCLACRGVVGGYDDGTFRPHLDVTRGQIAKVVSESAGFQENPGQQMFDDVPQSHTFYAWINRLAHRGVLGGYACGGTGEPCGPRNLPYFRPFANATRGQLSKIVSEAAGYIDNPTGQTFADVPAPHPFYIWVERLATRGVMGGYLCGAAGEPCDAQNRPYFRPFNNVTRGQASKIVAGTFFRECAPRASYALAFPLKGIN